MNSHQLSNFAISRAFAALNRIASVTPELAEAEGTVDGSILARLSGEQESRDFIREFPPYIQLAYALMFSVGTAAETIQRVIQFDHLMRDFLERM